MTESPLQEGVLITCQHGLLSNEYHPCVYCLRNDLAAAERERDEIAQRYDECATDNAKLMDERDELRALLREAIDAQQETLYTPWLVKAREALS